MTWLYRLATGAVLGLPGIVTLNHRFHVRADGPATDTNSKFQPLSPKVKVIRPIRIAIIGSGIGASSTLHFFKKLNPQYPFAIDLYERNDYIGGRMQHVTIDGHQMEAGAGIAIKANKYIWDLTDKMKLNKNLRDGSDPNDTTQDSKFGIWDPINRKFLLFEYYNYSFLNVLYILYHYGLFTFNSTMNLAKKFISDTQNIYDAQENGNYFKDSKSFWSAMNAYDVTQTDGTSHLYKQLTGYELPSNWKSDETFEFPAIMNELIAGIAKDNYNQNLDTNALMSLTAVAGMAGGSKDVWSITEGNGALCNKLIETALHEVNEVNSDPNQSVRVHLSHRVEAIENVSYSSDTNSYYRLHFANGLKSNAPNYDIVIVATPLHPKFSNIKFVGFEGNGAVSDRFAKDLDVINNLEYQSVISTFVKGKLRREHFDPNGEISEQDFERTNEILFGNMRYDGNVSAIAKKVDLSEEKGIAGYGIFKLFSTEEIDAETLDAMYETYEKDDVVMKKWLAYPKYGPKAEFASIVLDETKYSAMFYVNANEAATSAMEILAMSGRNVALMMDDFIKTHFVFELLQK